ncbi:MAG: hypothetical protein RIE52_04020 [Balneola sp.]|jgi:hypothetical protein
MALKLAFIGLSIIMVIVISLIGSKAINKTTEDSGHAKKKKVKLVGSLLLWHLYIFLVSQTGILQSFDFPPRFVLFLILPVFIFTGIFIYKYRNSEWIQAIPSSWLVYYQSFRIFVETLFVFSVAQGILHANVTIEGYNVDMIFAFTAPLVSLLVYRFKMLSERAIIRWNYLGLIVIASIIFLFNSSIYLPEIYGFDTPLMPIKFTTYPYIIVAGFLMPSAVFMHVLSIVQLKKRLA